MQNKANNELKPVEVLMTQKQIDSLRSLAKAKNTNPDKVLQRYLEVGLYLESRMGKNDKLFLRHGNAYESEVVLKNG